MPYFGGKVLGVFRPVLYHRTNHLPLHSRTKLHPLTTGPSPTESTTTGPSYVPITEPSCSKCLPNQIKVSPPDQKQEKHHRTNVGKIPPNHLLSKQCRTNPLQTMPDQPTSPTTGPTSTGPIHFHASPNQGFAEPTLPGQIASAQAHQQLYTSKTPTPSLTL